MLPSVFRFEGFPSLGFEIGNDSLAFVGGRLVCPDLMRDLPASVIANLPSDSMVGVVEGKDERFEFWG